MITGANQGGKSTFLRSVGVAQLMMQTGMFVAAQAFSADVRDHVFTHFKREEDAAMESGKLDEELARMSTSPAASRPAACSSTTSPSPPPTSAKAPKSAGRSPRDDRLRRQAHLRHPPLRPRPRLPRERTRESCSSARHAASTVAARSSSYPATAAHQLRRGHLPPDLRSRSQSHGGRVARAPRYNHNASRRHIRIARRGSHPRVAYHTITQALLPSWLRVSSMPWPSGPLACTELDQARACVLTASQSMLASESRSTSS